MPTALTEGPAGTAEAQPGRRGRLRVLLGAAPGSGKTFAMLLEGATRRRQGEDVVVGFVEAHNRPRTLSAIGQLETVPRLILNRHGRRFEDMDLDAVIARGPQVALVDELAHTNADGMRHHKRWEDIDELRGHGIDVVTTVDVANLESVKDLAEHIAGVSISETVPDRILDGADEIQFLDISPEALRKRVRHGNVIPPEKVDTALTSFFRPGNLAALREIALRLLADTVGAARTGARPEPEDVLVVVSGRPGSEGRIRGAARLARRTEATCTVVKVVPPHEGSQGAVSDLWHAVAEQVGAQVLLRPGTDVPAVVEATARELGVRHIVVGESRHSGGLDRWRPTLADRLIDRLRDIDVHVLAHEDSRRLTRQSSAAPGPLPQAPAKPPEGTPARGTLRVYMGYSRGCGTTMAMLDEARRRRSRGADVVVASISTHGRGPCEDAVGDLEQIGGPSGAAAQGTLDVEALLARHPQVAVVDDLWGVDVRSRPRVDAVEALLDAGITVVGTLHLGDLESGVAGLEPGALRDRPGRPMDDRVLALADEIELVDVTPSILQERVRRGDIVPASAQGEALEGDFRPEVLTALREKAFRLIAQHTDRRLVAYMRERGIARPWGARPRVLAVVPPRSGMKRLIRRAASLAAVRHAEFKAVTVRTGKPSQAEKEFLAAYDALTHRLGGEFVTLSGSSVATTLADYARRSLVTEIVMTRGRARRLHRTTVSELVHMMSDVDIHVLSDPPAASTT